MRSSAQYTGFDVMVFVVYAANLYYLVGRTFSKQIIIKADLSGHSRAGISGRNPAGGMGVICVFVSRNI